VVLRERTFVAIREGGIETKHAATFAMSSALSWIAIAFIIAVGLVPPGSLRVPS